MKSVVSYWCLENIRTIPIFKKIDVCKIKEKTQFFHCMNFRLNAAKIAVTIDMKARLGRSFRLVVIFSPLWRWNGHHHSAEYIHSNTTLSIFRHFYTMKFRTGESYGFTSNDVVQLQVASYENVVIVNEATIEAQAKLWVSCTARALHKMRSLIWSARKPFQLATAWKRRAIIMRPIF